jgi:elongator complex protein 1
MGELVENLLITPFRTQNVPPPMSTLTLALSSLSTAAQRAPTEEGAEKGVNGPRANVPVHAALAAERDVLAVLWEDGRVGVWDLRTRLGPGRGKAVDPVMLWRGDLGGRSEDSGSGNGRWRQASVSVIGERWTVVLLGEGESGDEAVRIDGDGVRKEYLTLPGKNGRLVGGEAGEVWWQSTEGEIHNGNVPPRRNCTDQHADGSRR